MIWYDGPIVLKVCPVRHVTPEADYVLGVFRRCYQRRSDGFGPVTWQRQALPAPGALQDQDAWLMSALDWVGRVMDRLECDVAAAARREREQRTLKHASRR